MFLKLFFALKAARVPVSLREHLTLIEAMDAGPAIYDVDAFYYLARAALVKDERHLDRFDRVIGEVFMSRFERQGGRQPSRLGLPARKPLS